MVYKSIFFSIVPFIIFLAMAEAVSGQLVYVSTFDPVNRQIEELLARGYLKKLNVSEKPWLRSDIIGMIREEETGFDEPGRKIAGEILAILRPPQRRPGMSAGFEAGLDLRGLSRERREGYFIRRGRYIDRGFKNELGSDFRGGWWLSRDDLWGIDARMVYSTDGTGYPWFFGRPREARTVVQFDHSYAAFRLGSFDLTLGRQRIIWGASPRGSLILDDGSPPFDMGRVSLRVAPFRLSWFGARLDDYYDPVKGSYNRRYFSGHRLNLNTAAGWEIGLTEVVLYGGQDRLPELYYMIPVTLYYWEAHNHSQDDNVLWEFDLSWAKKGLGRFYTQFVADDIQYKNRGPQKFALQIGSYLIPAKLPGWSAIMEFNLVDTYVYGQRQRRNPYLNWEDTISRLDSDQYEIFIALYRNIMSDLKAGAVYTKRGKGEYDARDNEPGIVPLEIEFPSGTVEQLHDIGLTASLTLAGKLNVGLIAGYQMLENYRQVENASLDQFYSTIDISYSFDIGLPFWTKYH